MNLRWITLFAIIAEEGSFTRAATRLNVAQPWLSAQLRKLEYELGVKLLVRESSGICVTEAGAILLPHAQQLAQSAQMFRQIARGLSDDQSKLVQVGSYLPIIDMPALKNITVDYASRYKGFELNVSIDDTSELLKTLAGSSLDFAVVLSPLPEDVADIEYRSLGKAHVCLLSPKARSINSLADAQGQSIGVPPRNWVPELSRKLQAALQQAGATAREVPEFDHRALEHLVLAHDTIVATLIDDQAVDRVDPRIHVAPIKALAFEHLLCRVSKRHLGRAAERFWALAEAGPKAAPKATAKQ